MVRLTTDADPEPTLANHPFHHTNGVAAGLQDAPLLDMQFEKSCDGVVIPPG